jgi:hypothetical protein
MNNQSDQKFEQLKANLTSAIEAYVEELVKREISQFKRRDKSTSADSSATQRKKMNLSEVLQKLSAMVSQIKSKQKEKRLEGASFSLDENPTSLTGSSKAEPTTEKSFADEFNQLMESIDSFHSHREQAKNKLENNLVLLEKDLGTSSEKNQSLVDQVNQLQRSFMANNQTDSWLVQEHLAQLERTVTRLMNDSLTVGEKKPVNDLYQILDRVKQNRYSSS